MRPPILWILLTATLTPHIGSAGSPAAPIAVCDLLKDPSLYDGQIVRVRAQMTETGEGAWLEGEHCPGVFTTEGYVWDSIIAIAYPGNYGVHTVDFEFDQASRHRIMLKYQKLRHPIHRECLEWTFTGLFETKRNWTYGINGTPIGFGHQGGAPAQLIVKSEDDVVVIQNCPRGRR